MSQKDCQLRPSINDDLRMSTRPGGLDANAPLCALQMSPESDDEKSGPAAMAIFVGITAHVDGSIGPRQNPVVDAGWKTVELKRRPISWAIIVLFCAQWTSAEEKRRFESTAQARSVSVNIAGDGDQRLQIDRGIRLSRDYIAQSSASDLRVDSSGNH